MQESDREQLNKARIELHLKSAMDALTPDVYDRIDLSAPQDAVPRQEPQTGRITAINRRIRGFALAATACLCVMVMGGGAFHYRYQNGKIDSVIGIDVNPSVELSINRKNKVLSAEALNVDAQAVMEEMDLKGVDLNVAVNAVIGSMVTHGYLDDLDNAILVTVSNDSVKKATELRTTVVGDIEKTLEENQVQAVVYDQQVVEQDEMKELAAEYGISYGKAYFLKELIDQNQDLTMDDMEELSSLTMEEIAQRITESSYALGELADKVKETAAAATTVAETTTVEETTTAEETETSSVEETTTQTQTTPAETTTTAVVTQPETEPEQVEADQVEIDYVDYEDGKVYVYFVTRVKWKHPTVAVTDEDGNTYAALVDETSSTDCEIEVSGLEGGKSYTFVLGGLTPMEGGNATTVTGYFDKPDIAGGATDPADDNTDETTTAPTTAPVPPSDESPGETVPTEPTTETEPESTTEVETTKEEPETTEAVETEAPETEAPETTGKEAEKTAEVMKNEGQAAAE